MIEQATSCPLLSDHTCLGSHGCFCKVIKSWADASDSDTLIFRKTAGEECRLTWGKPLQLHVQGVQPDVANILQLFFVTRVLNALSKCRQASEAFVNALLLPSKLLVELSQLMKLDMDG